MIIRTHVGEIGAVHAYVEGVWKKIFPGRPAEIKPQEEIVHEEARTYNTNLSSIFLFITVLGCLLSASGIYALATLNVQKRTKEIGIRKVLGASVQSILQLVNREFLVLLTLAALLGSVGGYTLTTALLNDLFAQHVEVNLLTLTLCSLMVFISGMLATSGTILNTARKNPTTSLRSE
jgi:ABC-type antimicrobial peptide transport system permease subunit